MMCRHYCTKRVCDCPTLRSFGDFCRAFLRLACVQVGSGLEQLNANLMASYGEDLSPVLLTLGSPTAGAGAAAVPPAADARAARIASARVAAPEPAPAAAPEPAAAKPVDPAVQEYRDKLTPVAVPRNT